MSAPRLGVMPNLHMAIVYDKDDVMSIKELDYKSQDLCAVMNENKHTHIKAYFHPNHSRCREVNAEMNINNVIEDKGVTPKIAITRVLQNSSMLGGDQLTCNGYSNQKVVAYIRCQCSMGYRQASEPKGGSYRQDTYINNRKNNRSGEVGAHGIKQTVSLLPRSKTFSVIFTFRYSKTILVIM